MTSDFDTIRNGLRADWRAESALNRVEAAAEQTEKALANLGRELVWTEDQMEAADARWESVSVTAKDNRNSNELVGIAFRAVLSSPDTMSAENKESLACTKRYHVVPGGIREPLDTRMYRCACGLVLMSGNGTSEIRFGLMDRLYLDPQEGAA